MGAAQLLDIHGAKGGSDKPKTPTEAPDSLRSIALAKMLIAVGEGEFDGIPTAKNIYLDNTPLQDEQGNLNFPNVKWEWRTGSVEQPYIPGIPSVENETTLGIELRSGTPWVRSINNTQLSAIRLRFAWPMLQSIDASGSINGYRIEYKVEVATDGGAYKQVLSEAVDGKTTSIYERTRRIDLPKAASGWLLRVNRITVNQNNNKIADTMQIAGFTEVIDAKLRYPNTALLYIEFSAEQFRNIPAITIECDARKMAVPSNYDSRTRSYVGIWDGTFKQAWTDNPVWMTYDITVNDRFGLGRRIKPWQVDKWELYRIAQYCDQLVPDSRGGMEPRFICNLNLQGKADAWTLLRDISAIYRGMTYWAQGQVFSLSDMPRSTDFDFAYTRANVVDGKFTYASASERTRYSRALISYDNPANNYDTDVTAVTDSKLQRRYGDNPLEISAIGCTRESEAQRRGKWALLTNAKDRAVTFRTGLAGRIPLPGYVIPIADELIAGRPVGGLVSAVGGKVITLDRETSAKPGDRLILNLPDGKCEGRTIQLVSGRKVTVTTAYSVAPEPELVWCLDADDLAVPLYRVTSVSRPESGVFEISAVQYEPSKFAHIDTGARLEERPISVIPITVVPAPASVVLTSNSSVAQGLAVTTMTIAWESVPGAVAYDVEWRKDSGNWTKVQRTGSSSVDVTGIYAGAYLARVRAVSAFDISSIWKSSHLTQLNGKEGLPPAVTHLTTESLIYGIRLNWGFPAGAEDAQRTEIWQNTVNSVESATKLGDFAYPQARHEMQNIVPGTSLFFWARLVDRTGNVGPWFPEKFGVNGQPSADQTEYEKYFVGKIQESAFGQALLDKIERIELIEGDGPGSVNDRLNQAKKELEGLIDEITDALEYDNTKAYAPGEVVRLGNRLFQAITATTGHPPPDFTYWLDMGTLAETTNALVLQVQKNSASIIEQDGKITVQGKQLSAIDAKITDPETGLDATASGLSSLTSTVETLDGKVTATAEKVDGVYAFIDTGSAGDENGSAGDERSSAGAESLMSVIAERDFAQAVRTDRVEVQVGANAASIIDVAKASADANSAMASKISQVSARVGDTAAMVEQVSKAVVDVDGRVSAQTTIKAETTSGGRKVMAGLSIAAGDTSEILAFAQRFAIIDEVTGQLRAPFVVQDGQVFINYAMIDTAFIQNLVLGMTLRSSAVNAKGLPLLEINIPAGLLTLRSAGAGGSSTLNNDGLAVDDENGVLRTLVGKLTR
ncbi:phage tail protein [Pseudomonas fragi]|uniref:phage tail protein n=1 Tax=Pseudomonas fragi TaxID=296 RepID=UPI0030B6EDCB